MFVQLQAHPIRIARVTRGLTLRTLGALAKVEYSKISRAEHGLTLQPDELARIAGVLDVPAAVLRGEHG